MSNLSAFQPAGAHIVYQTIDGEVILINLRDGFYFSITNSGTIMWEAISTGLSGSEAVDTISAYYKTEKSTVEKDFFQFVEMLQAEGLIMPSEPKSGKFSAASESAPRAYTSPKLEKFSDMEDILTLDPIHDVSESGWPNK